MGIIKYIKETKELINSIKERDPAARNSAEVFFLYPGFRAVMHHRAAHWFYTHKMFFIARYISQRARHKTGIEIHPGAKIGRNLFIDHGMGVVIGETSEIGDNCIIYQGVTLGGTGKDKGKRHPTLGDNVLVGTGAKILGPFKVGNNSKIAGGAVVLHEIPENSTAVGVPARVIRIGGEKVKKAFENCTGDLDQVNIPDPVEQEICMLKKRVLELEHIVKNVKKD